MPQRASSSSSLMRPFVVLALPGMYLLYKYNQYRQQQMETARRRVTERELMHLNTKIDKLLNKLEENEPELASSPEEECVICVNAKATMQTSPCGHRVVCRRCFVKTIQMAVSQRLLPLRCVICRAKILRLRQAPRLVTSKSWQVSSSSGKSWGVPGSVSSYSVGARSVPASASLYSVTSGESSLSGVSSVSSNSGGNVSGCSTKLCGGSKCGGACLGAIPRPPAATHKPRQPASNTLRRSQQQSMKARLQEYQMHSYTGGPAGEPSGRLPPIREFQRDFREGRRESAVASCASTRIRCAQKIVTQLETSPQKDNQHFFRPLKPSNKDDTPRSRDQSKETDKKKDNPKAKPKKEEKKKKEEENTKSGDKSKKDESSDNKKNEIAERKKEEKLRLKAEKEAKKEAKLQAKEEERQAKLLAKEEERQAKLLAKEEKKKAKKEAKLAAQAEKEKAK
ncbi:actin cytoskeleton-regulatory complex protein PAN1 isoform X1 [Papilio machaon]|uniref:actin cytoskeleton-regulatory complex protein PAN1 isoform X1 n=1 Tax=Papilio machaon TaxID=76193 RepID=UPI0006EADE75|nr:actin cytoskeleton-regulatory complex protein PAN1 isoform X1 [Papilio machaon]XP_014371417.1 actin cytoskeleton-regulatory complex protein PAN1 isoform X1 [Papilio machaon]